MLRSIFAGGAALIAIFHSSIWRWLNDLTGRLQELSLDTVSDGIDPVVTAIENGLQISPAVRTHLETANSVVPVSAALTAAGIYLGFLAVLAVWRVVWRFIPTMSW